MIKTSWLCQSSQFFGWFWGGPFYKKKLIRQILGGEKGFFSVLKIYTFFFNPPPLYGGLGENNCENVFYFVADTKTLKVKKTGGSKITFIMCSASFKE